MTEQPPKTAAITLQPGMLSPAEMPNLSKYEALGVLSPLPVILGLILWWRKNNSTAGRDIARNEAEKGILSTWRERMTEAVASEKEARQSERDAWRATNESLARIAMLETQNKYQAAEIQRLQNEGSDLRKEISGLRHDMRKIERTFDESGFGPLSKE